MIDYKYRREYDNFIKEHRQAIEQHKIMIQYLEKQIREAKRRGQYENYTHA